MPSAIKIIDPSLVRIDTSGQNFTSAGSGCIVDKRGYILTNQHVIDQATHITITIMGGSVFDAKVVATDMKRDLALLKLSTTKTDFPPASLGTSAGVIVGEQVVAAGFPLGQELPGPASFHLDVISALRTLHGLNYIQIDAIINPGNSGGCLIGLDGKVIGITSAGVVPPNLDAEGIGLAIPIDEAKSFINEALGG